MFVSSNGNFDIQKDHINNKGNYVITAGLSNNGIWGKTEVAAKILDGKDPSDIPIDTMKELKITINKDVVEKLNITVPSDIKEKAKFVTGGVHAWVW